MDAYAIRLKDSEKLDKYADQWVAFFPETREIISSSYSARKALESAASKGEADPILTHVPKRFNSYVLSKQGEFQYDS